MTLLMWSHFVDEFEIITETLSTDTNLQGATSEQKFHVFPERGCWSQPQVWRAWFPPHSTSRLAWQAHTGLAHHRVLDVDDLVASSGIDRAATGRAPAVAVAVYDWDAANQRKIDAVQQLAPLAEALDDLEARIAESLDRTRGLELG